MTRTEADTERELEEGESGKADSVKLAKFLTPVPRPKSSMPPAPSTSALRAPPAPKERASLFSDLPVPRKNSSLRPPAAVTETPPVAEATHVEAPRVEPVRVGQTAPLAALDRARALLEGFDQTEGPTENVALETRLREGKEEDEDDDVDLVPLSRPPMGRIGARRAAIAAGALAGALVIVIVAKRAMSPSPAPAPSSSAASALAPREPNAPTDDTLEETDDVEFPTTEADPVKGRELRRQARQLLERGSTEEGVRVSRVAIQADPNDPEGYILLAAGLQDLGRWQESRDVFAKCVQESSRRPNAECVYFATRSK
jgi:hypothetical protein